MEVWWGSGRKVPDGEGAVPEGVRAEALEGGEDRGPAVGEGSGNIWGTGS